MQISKNTQLQPTELIHYLLDNGYRRVSEVKNSGDFHHQGSIVRFWPVDFEKPIVVDFFGDSVDSIYTFDDQVGRKLAEINSIKILPNSFVGNGDHFLPNDFVVHLDHGVGIFWGLGLKEVEKESHLYIIIEYENNSRLYVPLEYADKISRYIGVGNRKPRLNRLGSVVWQNSKKKVQESIFKLARELIEIAAKRQIVSGHSLSGNPEWQEKLSKSFPFAETKDQKTAIGEVNLDLASEKPMDRLIVGDVGFGKTEIALRALLQAVSSGYQVALLAPTTILVEQHFLNFNNRLREFPINLAKLSRLTDFDDNKKIIADLKNGRVDAVIGTHRLLGKDIQFNNLGLLIIDEEQKFGVGQKEKLKKLKETINVLTLSATPIPRTLFSSLSGLRDMSKIETPPPGRMPIQTKVERFDLNLIKKYLIREIERSGQVFYLHNNVSTIPAVADKLRTLITGIKLTIAHGQMAKEELSRNMSEFAEGKHQLLVCSTIIENGLDLPNVNTLIVDEADRFGLSDLYQIRGRIGRSDKQGYALFTINNKKITDNSFKRLKTLSENTAIGSGFQIALRDLEIRGGGNLLGREQHGNMEALGLVLYTRILEQTVKKLRASKVNY